MEVTILLEGYLEKCSTVEDQGKREWKKRYFVYKHFTASGIKCLEYYKDRNWRRQDPKGVLTLYPGYEVIKVHDAKRKFVFDIKTVEHTFRLSAHSEEEENTWILLLEKENIVKSFPVEPVHDELMQRIGAKETCQLHIADTELRLISLSDGYQLVAWPFTCLRRYMSARGKFTIEAGRRAPTGEGKFSFITFQHDEIYKCLDTVIKCRAVRGGVSTLEKTKTLKESINTMQTANIDKDNSYDHLKASPSPNPPHPTHPNYDKNILPPRELGGSGTLKNDDYAAPYGHMKPRESLTSFSSSRNSTLSLDTDTLVRGHDYHALDLGTTDATDGYNKLHTTPPTRRPPEQQGKALDKGDTEDFYNVISEVTQAPGRGEAVDGVYNVLDHGPNSPAYSKSSPSIHYDNKSFPQKDELANYDSLDHSLIVPHKGPVRGLEFGHHHGSIEDDDDAYNVLLHMTSTLKSGAGKDDLDNYSTLDRSEPRSVSHSPLRKTHSSPTVIPRKCPLTASPHPIPAPRVPRSVEDSSVSSVSSFGSSLCPLDMSSSFTDSQSSMSPPQSEQDFYTSVNYARMLPSTAAPLRVKHIPAELSKIEPPRPSASKPRKASAPDVLSRHMLESNLVSNLKATLEADGLDLMKPSVARRKFGRRVSTEETIPESETYAEIGEGPLRKGSIDNYLGNRDFRSPSAPAEPTEDIYDEPQMPIEGSPVRPKSLQLSKPRGLKKK